jgi:hypothetical protein
MKIKKALLWIVIVLFAIGIPIILAKDACVKHLVQTKAKEKLGIDMTIGKLKVKILGGALYAEEVTISNPQGFEEVALAQIPLFFVDCDLCSLFGGEKRLEKMEVHVKEIGIVKNKQGELSLNRFKEMGEGRKRAGGEGEQKEREKGKLQIDKLRVTIDQVKFVDFSEGEEPVARTIPIRVDHLNFKDVSSGEKIGKAIVMSAVMEAAVSEGGLENLFALADSLKGIGGKEMEEKLGELRKAFETGGKAPGGQ